MSWCVYIDPGNGNSIKPNFSKPPTPEMIEEAKRWGLAMLAKMKDLEEKGLCLACEGKGTRRRRDLDAPTFKLADLPCLDCDGTGKAKPAQPKAT